MNGLVLYAVVWLLGAVAVLSLATVCKDSNRVHMKKRSMSCRSFIPQNIFSNDLKKSTMDKLCNNTVHSSPCYLCEKKETPMNSFRFNTTLQKISNKLGRMENITLYGKVIYDRTEYVICNMNTTAIDDIYPIFIWNLRFSCKRLASLDEDELPSTCGKTLNSDVCSIECSDGPSTGIQCPPVTTTLSTIPMKSTSSNKGTNGRERTPNIATLAGGVVGGALGGVAITVIVVVVWWICRKRSQGNEDDQGTSSRDSNIYLRLAPRGGSNSNATQPADNTATRGLNDTSHKIGYHRSEDIAVVSNEYAADSQEYVDIKDEELDGICGLSSSKATPNTILSNDQGPTAADTQKKKNTLDTYDRLRRQNPDSHPLPATWIRFNDTGITQLAASRADDHPEDSSASYCVLEDTDYKGTYNKLRSELKPPDKQLDTYNRLVDERKMEKSAGDMVPEYFVLENVEASG